MTSFINQDAAADFRCIICLEVKRDILRHRPAGLVRCAAIFCRECFMRLVNEARFEMVEHIRIHCPLRCGGTLGTPNHPRPVNLDHNERARLLSLLVKCDHPGCPATPSFGELDAHLLACPYNPKCWCDLCEVSISSEHNCKEYIRTLKAKLQEAQEQRPRRSGISTISTQVRSMNEYRGNPRIIVHRGAETLEITDMTIDQTGSDLRNRIEARFGTVGQLLLLRHQEIRDGWRLRQHSIGSKPVHVTVLPLSVNIQDGRCLKANLSGPGPLY